MNNAFLVDNGQFLPYGAEHIISVAICLLIGTGLILYSRKKFSHTQTKRLIVCISLLAATLQLSKVFIKLGIGNFNSTQDLPLHLCNILPFILPIAIISEKRSFWAVLYFWIMAGTFQSLITPTLAESFPHYEFLRYWIVHCGLVIAILFPIFVWDYRAVKKDIFNAWLWINILGFSMIPINLFLNSNYMYMMGKPPGRTMYDLLGPWPWYILSLEFVSIILFGLLYLPFMLCPGPDTRSSEL